MERNILYRETVNGTGMSANENYRVGFTRQNNGAYEMQPVLYEAPLQKMPVTLPKKIDEDKRNGYTCYVEIDLKITKGDRVTAYKCTETKIKNGKEVCVKRDWDTPVAWVKENEIAKMTAIYAPSHFSVNDAVDIIIYLHGHKSGHPGVTASIKQYLNYSKQPYFNFTEAINKSDKNIIFVAPTLGPRSQYGNLVKNFDDFMEQVLAAINQYFLTDRGLKGKLKMGRIIIGAHSGGGKAMLEIAYANQIYAKGVNEFWGFDSLYQGGGKNKGSWAWFGSQNNPAKKIYAYYFGTEATAINVKANAAKLKAGNVCIISSAVKDHFKLLVHYFKERLNNIRCITKTKDNEFEFLPSLNFDNENGKDAPAFKLKKLTLLTDKIVVGKHYEKEKVKGKLVNMLKETVKESPSYFLPIILTRALGKIGDNWFDNFTQIEFLGRKFKAGQYIHTDLAKQLQEIEKVLAASYGGAAKDPKVAGDFLLNSYEGLSGSRGQSSTATFSMHMFGLAIDVNYLRNPFIEKGDIGVVNAVTENAGLLLEGNQPQKYFHGMGYDNISKLDKLLEKYFSLIDSPNLLKEKINTATAAKWKNMDVTDAKKIINKDLERLATKLARGDNKEVIKKGGILDLPKEFVEAMINGGLHWGGFYGDMMHFDMRNTGSGKKVQAERIKYQKEKNEEAKKKYLSAIKKPA
jgi:hypothetical protein